MIFKDKSKLKKLKAGAKDNSYYFLFKNANFQRYLKSLLCLNNITDLCDDYDCKKEQFARDYFEEIKNEAALCYRADN